MRPRYYIATVFVVLGCFVAGHSALAQTSRLITTFTNPTPVPGDEFGNAVAALGSDRILIGAHSDNTGAPDAGAAYLFSTNGVLLTTFTNPIPATGDHFGIAVAAVGTDKVLVGAYQAYNGSSTNGGWAYLFRTNGTLLATFTNPTPEGSDWFGFSVAAVGTDKVLIGAVHDSSASINAGAAYLFRTNGTLLTTFTNPTAQYFDAFGSAVAAVGTDKVLIGAPDAGTIATNAGAAYLFRTNGTLLTSFTNPAPVIGAGFGNAVVAVGTDKVLIAAYDSGAYAGAAYLFSTNGTLLATFTNPAPALSFEFGNAVTAVGTNKVLIGAWGDNTDGTYAGAAYLFSTNGTLLTIITNPIPAIADGFGSAVTATDADTVVIAAYNYPGATQVGAAYLFDLTAAPSLSIKLATSNTAMISWPFPSTGFALQQNTNLNTDNWSAPSEMITNNGTLNFILVNPPTGNRFFRVLKP
jgi:hypothetical protein